MPICLPPTDKFPDEKGIVYVSGWRSSKDLGCTTGENGPDPFSKCKFPFFIDEIRGLRFNHCLRTKSPSAMNKDCKELYNLMIKRNGNTTSFLDNYGRVNTTLNSLIEKHTRLELSEHACLSFEISWYFLFEEIGKTKLTHLSLLFFPR